MADRTAVRSTTIDRPVDPWCALEFRAMGSRCRVIAPDGALAARGRALVERLESSWTRFRPDSELAAVNRSAGRLCLISDELHSALRVAEVARGLSGGRFDIRCLDAVEAAGYRGSWDEGDALPPCPDRVIAQPDGPAELFDDPPAVVLPPGQRIDLGGIGKGYAADLVVDELLAVGADRVQVELGGDIRVEGTPWVGDTWRVEIEHPRDPTRVLAEIEIAGGAVATSSVLRRRWIRDGVVSHHLIDMRTMRPAVTDLVAVTAIAATTWQAEVAAKSTLVAGSATAVEVLGPFGARALLVTNDGEVLEVTP